MFECFEPRPNVLTLHGELTLGHAHELRDRLFEALRRGLPLEVDLLNVTRLDTAGLQLLIVLHREAMNMNKPLRWLGFSLAVQEVFELLALNEMLGRPGAVLWS